MKKEEIKLSYEERAIVADFAFNYMNGDDAEDYFEKESVISVINMLDARGLIVNKKDLLKKVNNRMVKSSKLIEGLQEILSENIREKTIYEIVNMYYGDCIYFGELLANSSEEELEKLEKDLLKETKQEKRERKQKEIEETKEDLNLLLRLINKDVDFKASKVTVDLINLYKIKYQINKV